MITKEQKIAIIEAKLDKLRQREFGLEVEIDVYRTIGDTEIGEGVIKKLTYIKAAIKGFEKKLSELE